MNSNKKDIASVAKVLKRKRNDRINKIAEQLNSPQDEDSNKDQIQNFKKEITKDFKKIKDNLNEKFVGRLKKFLDSPPPAVTIILSLIFGVLGYFFCCYYGKDGCCYGPSLLAVPLIISKKVFCWTLLKTIDLLEKIPCEDKQKMKILTDSELVVVTLDDEAKVNLLFWISLTITALLGILLIGACVVGLVKLMKKDQTLLRIGKDGNWVYGGNSSIKKVQEEAGTS